MSLKPHGIMFASFKYGEGRRQDADGRIFYDLNEKTILPYLSPLFDPIEIWTSLDSRQGQQQVWLNILAKKKSKCPRRLKWLSSDQVFLPGSFIYLF